MLVRLVYVSYANSVMSEQEVGEILEKSKINNSKKNISGVLMYSDRYFFQCLEGERKDVNKTYLRIAADTRHSRCMQVEYSQVDCRLFANWSMEYVAYNGVADQLFAKYSENGMFMPYEFSAGQAVGLLTELSQAAAEANLASKKSLFSWLKK
jgi:hypothetical protein